MGLAVVYEEGMAKRTYQVTIPIQIEGRPVDELVLNVPASSFDEVKPILNKALKKLLASYFDGEDLAEVDHYEFDSDLALTPEEQIATVKWIGERRRERRQAAVTRLASAIARFEQEHGELPVHATWSRDDPRFEEIFSARDNLRNTEKTCLSRRSTES